MAFSVDAATELKCLRLNRARANVAFSLIQEQLYFPVCKHISETCAKLLNSYSTLCWFIRGRFSSVTLRWSAIFLLVNTGCSCWLILVPRSPSCLRTTSADFWSFWQRNPNRAASDGVWTGSVGCWRRLIAESMCSSGYFNFKNIPFVFLHSCERNSCVDDKRFVRSNIVLSSDRLYRLSTWLWLICCARSHNRGWRP